MDRERERERGSDGKTAAALTIATPRGRTAAVAVVRPAARLASPRLPINSLLRRCVAVCRSISSTSSYVDATAIVRHADRTRYIDNTIRSTEHINRTTATTVLTLLRDKKSELENDTD